MEIKAGDKVRWSSQAGGCWKPKEGVCLGQIPSGVKPVDVFPWLSDLKSSQLCLDPYYPSKNNRYLVEVSIQQKRGIKKVYYGPRMSAVQVNKESQYAMSSNLAFFTTKAMFNVGIQEGRRWRCVNFYSSRNSERRFEGVFWADLETLLAQIIQEGFNICSYVKKAREEYLGPTLLVGVDTRQLLTESECAKLFSLVATDFPYHRTELDSLLQTITACFAEWRSSLRAGA